MKQFERYGFIIFIFYAIEFMVIGLGYLILVYFSGGNTLISFADLNKDFVSLEGISSVWFIFLWALVVSFFSKRLITDVPRKKLIWNAAWLSVNAGFWEELIYRWLVLLIAIIVLPFINWCTFGFVCWFYTDMAIPFTNWITFGILSPQLLSSNWILGAAIISSTGNFRDAHKHLGFLGYINSWYIGLILFWVVFNYGIITAIAVHILYDLIIFMTEMARAKIIFQKERTFRDEYKIEV